MSGPVCSPLAGGQEVWLLEATKSSSSMREVAKLGRVTRLVGDEGNEIQELAKTMWTSKLGQMAASKKPIES